MSAGTGAVGSGPNGARRPADPEPWVLLEEKPGFDGFLTVKVRRYRLPDGREVDWDVFGPELNSGFASGVTVLPLTPEGRIVSIEVVSWFWSGASSVFRKYVAIARGCRPDGRQNLDETEDCVPVELTVDEFRTELRTPGAMTGTDAAYVALDHAGLL